MQRDSKAYLWFGTAAEDFIADPTTEVTDELTAMAFEMWLDWSHSNED